jgi:hypothetical protein
MSALAAVLLCGRAGAGKSTLAAAFVREKKYTEIAIAGPLKAICVDAVRLLVPECVEAVGGDDAFTACFYDPVGKETPLPGLQPATTRITPRVILQKVGTDIMRRHLGEDVFIWAVKSQAEQCKARGEGIVISDVRFPNEMNQIRMLLEETGFEVKAIRVLRPSLSAASLGEHASEAHADTLPVDVELTNSGTPEQLYVAAIEACAL